MWARWAGRHAGACRRACQLFDGSPALRALAASATACYLMHMQAGRRAQACTGTRSHHTSHAQAQARCTVARTHLQHARNTTIVQLRGCQCVCANPRNAIGTPRPCMPGPGLHACTCTSASQLHARGAAAWPTRCTHPRPCMHAHVCGPPRPCVCAVQLDAAALRSSQTQRGACQAAGGQGRGRQRENQRECCTCAWAPGGPCRAAASSVACHT